MKAPLPEEVVVDDDALLADRLVRSLHRNPDGHLSGDAHDHQFSVEEDHNVAVLYVYTQDKDGLFTMHEHYAYSEKSLKYKEWCTLAHAEARALEAHAKRDFYGVYGWQTSRIQITPLRTGDLFIKIDATGARGVRLTFGSRKTKRAARKS